MSNNKQGNTIRVVKNTIYLFFRLLIVACVGFYTSRVVLQVLGVEDYGIYNIVGSVVVFLSFFKNALNNATFRYLTYELGCDNQKGLHQTFVMSLNTHIILAILLWVILEIAGTWFINNELNISSGRLYAANWTFQISLLTFCFEIIKTPYNSIIIAHERMSFYAITSIVEAIMKLLVVYFLINTVYDKLILYALLLAGVSLIMLLWYILFCVYKFKETRFSFYWDTRLLKTFLSYSGWSLLVNASDVTVRQGFNIFYNIFGGVVVNAAMGIANQANAVLNTFLGAFTNSFDPQIIKSYASGDESYFKKILYSTSKGSFFLLFTISFPVILNIDYLLKIWLVTPPEYSGTFLRFVACYSLIDSFSSPLWMAVHATGKLKTHQILMSSIKILNLPLSYCSLLCGAPLYVPLLGYVVLNIVCAIVRIFYLRRLIHLPVKEYFHDVILKMLIVVIISIPIPICCLRFDMPPLSTLIASSLLFVIPYSLSVYYVGLNLSERNLVKSIVLKKFNKTQSC